MTVAATKQITRWLELLGLGEYAQRFADSDIDVSVLQDLTEHDLEKIGVSLGHRKKMLRAIAELADKAPAEPPRHDDVERRHLTIMFCDLVGSTALSSRLDPEELREVIGSYLRRCTETIVESGGFVARYMGDGVLAYFGYPHAHEDDAERAVRAGLALIETVAKIDFGAGNALLVRIGIATGLAVVGDLLGEGAAQERAVIGETPNLAARLQGLAEPSTVVICSDTHRLLGKLFEYRALGPVRIKGFGEPKPIWQVTGASAVDSRFEAFRTATTPLVGRDEEIELLVRHWRRAIHGDGQVILISGEPGIGKSRITQALLETLGDEPYARLRYFCSPHHQESALYPTIAQLERAAGFRREDAPEQRLDKLEAVLSQATNDLNEAVPLIAELLSIPTGNRYPSLGLTPQKRKEKTLHALLAHVEGLAARQSVLMVFEDIQWIDPTSRELLELTLNRAPTLRVLVILTFRPEFVPPWVGRPHVSMLTLSRLPATQCGQMIAHLTGGKALPKELADQIVDQTDGVPLFIEELTKSVLESGILMEAGAYYAVAKPVAALQIPTTLQSSLLARLDRLVSAREVAQIGAALGRQFSHELISAVAPLPQPKLDDALHQLASAGLMFRHGTPPAAEYTFKHALVQDAAYSTLLLSRRRELHGRIAATLEDHFPDIVLTQPAILAQHCTQAGLGEKAVVHWLKAGQQAAARSAMAEAIGQLQRGLDVLAGLPDSAWRQQQELDLQMALRSALAATKGYSAVEVGDLLARARALDEQLDRPEYFVRLSLGQWAFHLHRSEHNLALSLAEQVEKFGQARTDTTVQLRGRRAIGLTRCFLGEFLAARSLLEQCHSLGDPAHRTAAAGLSDDPYATMYGYLAVTLAYLGHIDQARLRLNEALSEARRLKHAQTLAVVLSCATWMESITCSPQMRLYAEELLAVSTEHGFPLHLGWATGFCGSYLTSLGRAQEGLTLIMQGLAAVRAAGSVANTLRAFMWLADAYAVLRQPAEGLNCLAEAAQIIATTDERYNEAELYRLQGELQIATGDQVAAEQNYHRALAVAQRQSAKTFELRAATSLATLWREQGKRAEARDLLAPVYNWFTEGLGTPVLKKADALLDQLSA
jgi:class 3 adenylate cyclase/tetratricopeptide (TPR) repeat protein